MHYVVLTLIALAADLALALLVAAFMRAGRGDYPAAPAARRAALRIPGRLRAMV
jgi:hypothetical protein